MKTYLEKLKDPRWQKKRLEILNRDDFTCIECGRKDVTLHVHHISYSTNPWETENKLLMTLCEDCHKEEESLLNEWSEKLIKNLRIYGFTSLGMACLVKMFKGKDRGWTNFEPSFDIISMIINDDKLWKEMDDLFWQRMSERIKEKKRG